MLTLFNESGGGTFCGSASCSSPQPRGAYWYFGEVENGVPCGFGVFASPSGVYEGDGEWALTSRKSRTKWWDGVWPWASVCQR